jgi:hypothetical protein
LVVDVGAAEEGTLAAVEAEVVVVAVGVEVVEGGVVTTTEVGAVEITSKNYTSLVNSTRRV